MASAPRSNSKATRIAFEILGVPSPLKGYYGKSYKKKQRRNNQLNDTPSGLSF